MKDIEKLISPLIEQQFPSIYREEGDTFIAFVKAYFEWMEETNGVLYDSRRLPEYRDIDTTIDRFVDEFRKKYMFGIPQDAVVDKRLLQKHIKELYASKGTAQGLKLLFRLLYNEDVDVYIPGEDILKASDGKWTVPRYIEMQYSENLPLYVGKKISGRVSKASAFVKNYQFFYVNNRRHDILYLEDLVGRFLDTEEIVNEEIIEQLGIDITQSPRVIGSLNSISIRTSEPGFKLGEVVQVLDGGFGGEAIVTEVKKLNGTVDFSLLDGGDGYTLSANVSVSPSPLSNASFSVGSVSNTASIFLTAIPISDALATSIDAGAYLFASDPSSNLSSVIENAFEFVEYNYGSIETITNINPGEGYTANAVVSVEDSLIYPLRIPDGKGGFLGKNAQIDGIAGFGSGAIVSASVYDSGIGYSNGISVTLISSTNSSLTAIGIAVSDKNGASKGFFANTDGFLNADKFVHDNFYYQDYSYEVRANLALSKYTGILRDLWHPGGTERFGRTVIKDEYKSRGTTVEALIDWLEAQEFTVFTNRFTDTFKETTIETEYLTTTLFDTIRPTTRETEIVTTFDTSISFLTQFVAETSFETATAYETIKEFLTLDSTLIGTNIFTLTDLVASRNTDTFVGTNTAYNTTTVFNTFFNTVYSTAFNTTTTFSTSRFTDTGKITTYNTSAETSRTTASSVSKTTAFITNFSTSTAFNTFRQTSTSRITDRNTSTAYATTFQDVLFCQRDLSFF